VRRLRGGTVWRCSNGILSKKQILRLRLEMKLRDSAQDDKISEGQNGDGAS
jgi:hypothetical protein